MICNDCGAACGFTGQPLAYSYGDHWKCEKCRDKHERALHKAERKAEAARMVES